MRHRRIAIVFMLTWVVLIASRTSSARLEAQESQPQFQLVPLPRDPAALRKGFTPDQLVVLERLNRRDVEHMTRADPPVPGLVVPVIWPAPADAVALSPLTDAFAWADAYPKALVVHQPWQAFAAYESGRLVRWGPVSTGRKETRTPSGLFNLTWRSKGRHSTDNAAWFLPWYFNFHNERGVSFHQFDLPGYPASHACVRLLERDAKWLYEWGEQWTLDETGRRIITAGTPVLIVGEYDYDSQPPWLNIDALSQRIVLSPPEVR
jgi:hypothetical protein